MFNGFLYGVITIGLFNAFWLRTLIYAVTQQKAISIPAMKALTTHNPYYIGATLALLSVSVLIGVLRP